MYILKIWWKFSTTDRPQKIKFWLNIYFFNYSWYHLKAAWSSRKLAIQTTSFNLWGTRKRNKRWETTKHLRDKIKINTYYYWCFYPWITENTFLSQNFESENFGICCLNDIFRINTAITNCFYIKCKHFLSTLPEGTPETLLWFLDSYQMSRQWQWQTCEFKQEKKRTQTAHQFTLIWSEFSNVELPAVRVSIGHSSKRMNQPRSRHNQAHSWPGKWNVN